MLQRTINLSVLKKAVSNNFVPAFTVLGAVCMGIHYEVLEGYGMCPTPVAIGKKQQSGCVVDRKLKACPIQVCDTWD